MKSGALALLKLYTGGHQGNSLQGESFRSRGLGLIQISGRANYMACGEGLDLDLVKQPELLEEPQHACMSAA